MNHFSNKIKKEKELIKSPKSKILFLLKKATNF